MRYYFEGMDMCKQGIMIDNNTPKEILQYAVGALLYTPASYIKIVPTLSINLYPDLKSWSFCLEDALNDDAVEQAAEQLIHSLHELAEAVREGLCPKENIPLIFIRVRSAEQMTNLFLQLADIDWLLSGFIAPKFDSTNMAAYIEATRAINAKSSHPMYLMPILESPSILYKENRLTELLAIRKALETAKQWILNVRVGGNDFCNVFGLRRRVTQCVYDIGVINDVLTDIINIFGRDFVLSAPVWEYFGTVKNGAWQQGLEKELQMDWLNGFIGKTAIHPTQLLPIQQALVVEEADYLDALQISHWQDAIQGVSKGVQLERMNERRVHQEWAKKILALADVYGVKRSFYE